ncbi:MAG: hypothetical protein DVB26_00080 [Verrucomicrobia bacterium]|nr:MAG: hypothetical protein DVB26_00080 [Verrucomicrobiota bacterium]
MRGSLLLLLTVTVAGLNLTSCNTNKEPEIIPVPPTSNSTKIPWNSQGATGGGQGQFGMLQQNQYRR